MEMVLRKTIMVMVVAVFIVALSAGAALAFSQIDCASASQDPSTPECYGTPQRDGILGTNAKDVIYAREGDDYVKAYSGNDEVRGGAHTDHIQGGAHDDELRGGDGDDFLFDSISLEGMDSDELIGGEGDDVLDAFDRNATDTLVCGAGNDTAYYDKGIFSDTARDTVDPSCENKVANAHPN
jgi:Ca2+-binding RTX toxin-like protein